MAAHVCRLLGISRSGFYKASNPAQTAALICQIMVQIKASFSESGGCYDCCPLRKVLYAKGMGIGFYKVRNTWPEAGNEKGYEYELAEQAVQRLGSGE